MGHKIVILMRVDVMAPERLMFLRKGCIGEKSAPENMKETIKPKHMKRSPAGCAMYNVRAKPNHGVLFHHP